ncbi:Peptidase family M50 [uncultured archaeon]|nr:Peptidase family M50 [uncultured archaeon]
MGTPAPHIQHGPWAPPTGQPGRFYIDTEEWTHLITSILCICLALTFYSMGLNAQPGPFMFMMLVFGLTVGSGFLLHEMAHKWTAIQFGAKARFEAWLWGLGLMLALAIIPQIVWKTNFGLFLAPGVTAIFASRPVSPKQNGLISVAGPVMNLALAAFFFGLGILLVGGVELGMTSSPDATLTMICIMGIKVNLGLALFNLLPVFPLDGIKVLMWDWRIWLSLFVIALLGSSFLGF